jgi:hypothetical protein
LVDCLNALEGGPVASGSQSKTKVEDASFVIENCRKKLKLAQSHANKLNLQLGEIDGILAKMPKAKKKKTESPVLVDQKMLMKMLTQFSAKKKRKLVCNIHRSYFQKYSEIYTNEYFYAVEYYWY